MAPSKIVLLACGSFNPPTNMHLRMFEIARDRLHKIGQHQVVGGIISPVHDAYGKKELVPATYRCEMVRLSLKTSDWIGLSDWECSQEAWCRTRQVLQYHQNFINSLLSDRNSNSPHKGQRTDQENGLSSCNWVKNDVRSAQGPIQIKLLCGADLLESFATPGLWSDDDIEAIIGQHGLVVITRHGSNPHQFVYESDVLTKYQNNIMIVPEWITNDVSSTKIRRALRRQESVKYLLQEAVIDFIKKHSLYGSVINDLKYPYKPNINDNLNVPMGICMLTPSPSDVNMVSVSPSHTGSDIVLNLNSIDYSKRNIDEPDFSSASPAVLIKSKDLGIYESLETFQSRAEIKFYEEKHEEPVQPKSQTKVVQYPGQAVQVISMEDRENPPSPGKIKKVGFFDDTNDYNYVCVDICEPKKSPSPKKVIASVKQTPGIQKVAYEKNKTADKVKKLLKSPSKKQENDSDTASEEESPERSRNPPTPPKASPKKKKPPKRCSKTPDLRKDTRPDAASEKPDKSLVKSKHLLKRSNSDAVMSRRNENGEAVSVKIQFTKDGVKVISDKESIV